MQPISVVKFCFISIFLKFHLKNIELHKDRKIPSILCSFYRTKISHKNTIKIIRHIITQKRFYFMDEEVMYYDKTFPLQGNFLFDILR